MNDAYHAGKFKRCPKCRRSGTAKLTLHIDGDVWLQCDACDAYASVNKLHESSRTVQ